MATRHTSLAVLFSSIAVVSLGTVALAASSSDSGTMKPSTATGLRDFSQNAEPVCPVRVNSLQEPLNVVLVSDTVAQAEEIRRAAAPGTLAVIYRDDEMTMSGLADLLGSICAVRNDTTISHLGIVTHGRPGQIRLGKCCDLTLKTMQLQAPALERLRSYLTPGARLDLYACAVAAGPAGKAFVDELAALTGAVVFASGSPVGTATGAKFGWEYRTASVAANGDLLSIQQMQTIQGLYLYSAPNVANTTYYNTPNNPLAADANVGQCTWYVYGRIQETGVITAQRLSSLGLFQGGAANWYSDATSASGVAAGITTGTQPRPGAIAWWNTGHVAFVEDSSGNVTESNNTPANAHEVVIDGIVGYAYVKLRQSPSTSSAVLWTIPQFTVMSVTGASQTTGQYEWFPLSANDGNPNHTGWAAWLDANTGLAATGNFIWNFTRIKRTPSSPWRGTPSKYIYLPSQGGPAPSISGVSPSSYPPSSSNQTMTINGSNFQSGATLTFVPPEGGTIASTASKLTFVSANELTYQFNNMNDEGNWSVRVNNPDGQSSSYVNFTVTALVPSLSISSVTPAALQTLGQGQSVTYTIAVQDGSGSPVNAASVTVTDGVRRMSVSAGTTSGYGQLSYTTTVPADRDSGTYDLVFLALKSGYTDSPTVVRQVQVDATPPTILTLSVTPSSVLLGESVTILYEIGDSGGAGLKQAELWRASTGGSPSDDWTRLETNTHLGNGPLSGSFTDSPSSPGPYWYGLHVVDNVDNVRDERQQGLGPIQVTVVPVPTITVQPVSQTVQLGQTTTFSVMATGSGTLSYQWRKDGLKLSDGGRFSGSGTASLTIGGATMGDTGGTYDVIVSDTFGSTISGPAYITVQGNFGWQPGHGVPGVNGQVYAMTTWSSPQGQWLVVGGGFTVAGSVTADNIAAWDGATWHALGGGLSGHGGAVEALTVYNGQLVAGGSFSTKGGAAGNHIAAWDGMAWQPLGSGMSGVVYALTVWNGQLLAGGSFTTAGGMACNGIASWDGAAWHPLGSGMNGYVEALAVYNGQLVAGGYFTTAGGVTCNGIAAWDGAAWHPLGSGMDSLDPWVTTLKVYNGQLVAGGAFTTAGGVTCNGIAAWDGTAWCPLGSGMTFPAGSSPRPLSLAAWNGQLVAGGYFTTAGGVTCNYVAIWDGTDWHPLGDGTYSDVQALAVYNGQLLAGGTFIRAGGVGCASIASWDGAAWHPLGSGMGDSYLYVTALAVYNGQLVVGGEFWSDWGGIASWDGTAWRPLGTGMDGSVRALAVYNGQLVAGGEFQTAGGVGCSGIAVWDGIAWHPLGSGMGGLNPYVYSLTVCNDHLVAGGAFTTAGGVTCNGIAAWDGTTWCPLGSGMSDGNYTFAVAVYNGQLVAGGYSSWGWGYGYIVSWDGTAWVPLGAWMDGSVKALAVYNGQLVAGGEFRTGIASWDGAAWQPLGSGMGGSVLALGVYNGQLVAGGCFTTAGGAACTNIASWDGTAWHSLDGGVSGMSGMVQAVTVDGERLVVGGGDLVLAGRAVSAYLARWGLAPMILQQPTSRYLNGDDLLSLSVVASGTGTLAYQWRKDGLNLSNSGRISGAATPTLTIAGAGPADPGAYDVVVTDTRGSVVSSVAPVTLVSPVMQVTPADRLVVSGYPGGAFGASSRQYTVTNAGTTPLTWMVGTAQPWVTASPPGGTLAPGDHVSVVLSLSPSAAVLSVGAYTGLVTFANISSGIGDTTRTVSLTVKLPGDINGDGGVDVIDLLYLVDAFGSVTGDVNYDDRCDFNGDGSVDVIDLLDMVANFGT